MILVEVYSKHECHLCDDAKAVIRNVQVRYPFELREIFIEDDAAAEKEFSERVPVVFINRRFAFQHKVTEQSLIEALHRAR